MPASNNKADRETLKALVKVKLEDGKTYRFARTSSFTSNRLRGKSISRNDSILDAVAAIFIWDLAKDVSIR